MAKKKKEKEQYDKTQYQLDINESMMFLIQELTGDSTAKIISYFHDIALLQQKEIEKSKNPVNGYYGLSRKTSYGYYPNTKLYFVTSTVYKEEAEVDYGASLRGMFFSKEFNLWTTTVSMPRSNLKFEHDKLKTLLAEAVLIGDAAAANIEDPSIKNAKGKKTIKDLENNTESTED